MSIFNSVFVRKPDRSLFNLTHEKKFSADWANLYPVLCMECVPGDTIKVNTELLIRTSPLTAPVMHRVNVKVHYFFVPNRLLWKEWEDFITGCDQQKSYAQSPDSYFVNPVPPYAVLACDTNGITSSNALEDGTLADFLGFPTHRKDAEWSTSGNNIKVPLLPFAAYQKIYDDWYRNQNVEAPHFYAPLESGQEVNWISLLTMRQKMWEKDYFTSALPFAQRGDPVDIPWTASGLRLTNDSTKPTFIRNTDPDTDITASNNVVGVQTRGTDSYKAGHGSVDSSGALNVVDSVNVDVTGHTTVVTDGVVSGTINDLRIATRLQRWLEKNARVGGRYIEQLLAHFGIHSSDARLQRAEYLGGWTNPIVVSDVEQTSQTTFGEGASPQANLAGKGTSYGSSKPIKCFCEEHGFLFAIMSILPRTSYQDQLSKMWQRDTRYDYYFPEFAHLGEQEVNKAEVFFDVTDPDKQSTDRFGFQERFCEYKYIPSSVHGDMKGNLSFWHLGRQFTSQPALNYTFVKSNPRDGIFAVESGDHFYVNLINHVSALRPMPKQAIPTL